MLEEFEFGINNNDSNDYWYDDRLFYYQDMLDSFSDEEWKKLYERIVDYSEEAQMRCVECLSAIDNRNSLSMILILSDTQDRELFVTCVDSLRNMDLSSLSQSEKVRLLKRVKEYSTDASKLENIVFKVFIDAVGF